MKKPRRVMTELEMGRLTALASCRFPVGAGGKRFVLDMRLRQARAREEGKELEVTERQAWYLAVISWRFRGQLKARGLADLVPESEVVMGEQRSDHAGDGAGRSGETGCAPASLETRPTLGGASDEREVEEWAFLCGLPIDTFDRLMAGGLGVIPAELEGWVL